MTGAGQGPLNVASLAIADVYRESLADLSLHEGDDLATEDTMQRVFAMAEGAEYRLLQCGIAHPRHAAYALLAVASKIDGLVDGRSLPSGKNGRKSIAVDADLVNDLTQIVRALLAVASFTADPLGDDLSTVKEMLSLEVRH